MKQFLNTHFLISIHLLVFALVIVVASYVVHTKYEGMRVAIEKNIERQISRTAGLAVLTDGNGADEVVSKIIVDCPNRAEFENLLMNLGSLPKKSLVKSQQLLESCGGYHAERKALMVSRLDREFEILQDNWQLLAVLDPGLKVQQFEEEWARLINFERQRSELLQEQVIVQNDIITELISGSTTSSPQVQLLASRGQEIGELLSVLDKQIDTLRETLTN